MKAFARLYAALDETTATNEKVAALVRYFRPAPPADAAWAVHFLIGRRPKRLVRASNLRAWAAGEAGVPDWLFEESYHAVGDLAETITLLLPDSAASSDLSLAHWVETRLLPLRGQDDAVQRARAGGGLARARARRALRLEQADHRGLPRGRVGEARGPGAGRGERGGRGHDRASADGRLGADGRVLRAADRAGHPRRRREPAVPVLPRLPARGGSRLPRRSAATGWPNGSGTASARSSSAGQGGRSCGPAARSC